MIKKFLLAIISFLISIPTLGFLGGLGAGLLENSASEERKSLGQTVFFWTALPMLCFVIFFPYMRTVPDFEGLVVTWPFWPSMAGVVLLALVSIPAAHYAAKGNRPSKYLVFLLSAVFTFGLFGIGYGLGRWKFDRHEAKLSLFWSIIPRIIPIILFLAILVSTSFPAGNIWQGIVSLLGIPALLWSTLWLLKNKKSQTGVEV